MPQTLPTRRPLGVSAPAVPTPAPRPRALWSPGLPAIDLAELIGREPYDLDRDAVARVLTGKRILITGAGGSIGSELTRVAATFDPALLILMERSENALFEIDRQLGERFPTVGRRALLHDIVDRENTLRLVEQHRPHVILHSAAHKHVPLMEDHPAHALTNNLFGTQSITDAASQCGAERFVMISSDKAVNPTSVMGATKRLAELYVGHAAVQPGNATRMSMVRFGNVLGSACSVLTIWSSQLTEGSPLTVTDRRMTRFFMTIPEAATLVIQSMTLGDTPTSQGKPRANSVPAGVFVLDMGEPVSILELAKRFARAHGLDPREVDAPRGDTGAERPSIEIRITGIRPGEKLHEELAYSREHLEPTSHPGIRTWKGGVTGAPGLVTDGREMIDCLSNLRGSTDAAAVISAIKSFVPEMTSPARAAAA